MRFGEAEPTEDDFWVLLISSTGEKEKDKFWKWFFDEIYLNSTCFQFTV